MKTFLKILSLLTFVAITPLFVFFLSLRLTNLSPEVFKAALSESGIYVTVIEELDQWAEKSLAPNSSDNSLNLLWPYFKKQLNPGYLQVKTEILIDDTNDWLSGKVKTPPVLSFKEIKTNLIGENNSLINTFSALAAVAQKQQQTMDKKSALPAFDLKKFVESDFAIPLGSFLAVLKPLHLLISLGPFFFGFILFLSLVEILLFASTSKNKCFWLSATFFMSLIWNMILLLIFITISRLGIQSIPAISSNIPAFLLPLLNAFISPISSQLILFSAVASGVLFVGTITNLVLAFVFSRNPRMKSNFK